MSPVKCYDLPPKLSPLKYHGTLPVCGIPILLETYNDKVPNPDREQGESIPRSTPTFDL